MISKDILPSEHLRKYIKQFRLRHFVTSDTENFPCKPFPPRPEQCLVFFPRGYEVVQNTSTGIKCKRPTSIISGQFTYRINRYLQCPEMLMIEVNLQPGALNRLTGIPLKPLANQDLDAETIFPEEFRRVNERLNSAEDYGEMISIIECFFDFIIKRKTHDFTAVDDVLIQVPDSISSITVDSLARMCYLSPRQMERKFDEKIGISPKTFLRISRFNASYLMHQANPKRDWLSIAIHCGYSDYQHLVKDYKDFAGNTPVNFFGEDSMAPGRMLGLSKYG
jgi:AraC-like DNA-binding protein